MLKGRNQTRGQNEIEHYVNEDGYMRNRLLLMLKIFLVIGMVFALVSCNKISDNTDGYGDDFWMKEEKLFSPRDIERKETDRNVEALYASIKTSKPDNIVLESGEQIIALNKRNDGTYEVGVYIVNGEDYIPMFVAGKEIIPGFGYPSEYETGIKDGDAFCVLKGGKDGNSFSLMCTALSQTGLIKFSANAVPKEEYRLIERDFGLIMNGKAEVSYGQMPVSIYGNMFGRDSVGIGMPAAYLWDKGREAVILMNYTDMTWMSQRTFLPGRDGYVRAAVRKDNTVFGLCYGNDRNGKPMRPGSVPAGENIHIEFVLWSGLSAKRSGADCMARKVEVVSSQHPVQAPYPKVRADLSKNVNLSWKTFSDGTVDALLNPLSFNKVAMNLKEPMLTSEKRSNMIYVGYARQSQERYAASDFSCNNNWLSSLAMFNRLNGRSEVSDLLSSKMDALQFYYDPEANIIRYGFRCNNQVGEFEMPWQNMFYHAETYRSSINSDISDFNPAALSNLISAADGLTELVEKNGYLLSQWVNPVNKTPAIQQDVPDLNIVYEPWQIGTYAYVCLKLRDVTGSEEYTKRASVALDKVINELEFTVKNKYYTKKYSDSAEFPITELFGTANGTYASYRLFELTGEERYLKYSEDFFGMLAQLTFWCDDNLSDAAKDSTLYGLFEPHGGASHACPWETIEALLPLTEILNSTGDYLFNDLILRILNCQRVSAFNFYPVVWNEKFFGRETAYNQKDFLFIPTEPLYNTLGNGNGDYGALYMSSLSLWNYLMFEAYGTCDNPEIMVLCTDIHGNPEDAFTGAQRSFGLYNPGDKEVSVNFIHRELQDGSYFLTIDGEQGKKYSAEQLREGINVVVPSGYGLRMTLTSADKSLLVKANQIVMTKYRLAVAYNAVTGKIQSIARNGFSKIFPDASEDELDSMSKYVVTYMCYGDAMAHALNANNLSDARQAFLERRIVNGKMKKLYAESEYLLGEEYDAIINAIDEAAVMFRQEKFKEAYEKCDLVIQAVNSGTEKAFANRSITE